MSNVETLRCNETMDSPMHHEISHPHFCKAIRDRAILQDERVLTNLLALEGCYVPNIEWSYTRQEEIRLHMRKEVTDWMLDVCIGHKCPVDVLLLAANIMDRFLGTIILQKSQFQLLGAAAIFLASKLIEPEPITATALVKCTADTYQKAELLNMEILILSKLKWDLTAVTPYDYLDHVMNALTDEADLEGVSDGFFDSKTSESIRRDTEKIILLCATEPQFAKVSPSLLACASIMTALQHGSFTLKKIKHGGEVNLNHITHKLQSVARFELDDLKETIKNIEQLLAISETHCEAQQRMGTQQIVSDDEDEDPPAMTSTPVKESSVAASTSTTSNPLSSSPAPSSSSQQKQGKGPADSEAQNTTPTEVFKVSAYCVT